MLELTLIRHGQSTSNKEDRIQGQRDAPLSEEGYRQAKALGMRLRKMSFDRIYSSDLRRASQTALCIYPEDKVILDSRLREIHLGDFEGRLWNDLTDLEREQFSVFRSGPYDVRVPGGESSDDLRARAMAWLASLSNQGCVAAFTHAGFIVSLLQSIIGRPPVKHWQDQDSWGFWIENTSLTTLQIHGEYKTIMRVGDVAHLELL
jgi:broad specificity phosphatase PhoE